MAVLIVTCPCALSLATPAATLAAAGGLARRGVLVRRLQALEACAGIDTVVFDKTGTLTRSRSLGREQPLPARNRCRRGIGARGRAGPALAASRFAGHRGRGREPRAGTRLQRARRPRAAGVSGEVSGQGEWQPRKLKLGSAAFCDLPAAHRGATSQVHLADETGLACQLRPGRGIAPRCRACRGRIADRLRLRVQLLSGDQTARSPAPGPARRHRVELGRSIARGQAGTCAAAAARRPSRRHGRGRHERWPGAGSRGCVRRHGPCRAAGPGQGRLRRAGRTAQRRAVVARCRRGARTTSCARTWPGPPATTPSACRWPWWAGCRPGWPASAWRRAHSWWLRNSARLARVAGEALTWTSCSC